MSTISTKDGTEIYYKDWGSGRPVDQSLRSSQPRNSNDVNTHADDLSELFEMLDLNSLTLIGLSTGSGRVARYIARHGTLRVAKAVLVGGFTPLAVTAARRKRT